MTQVCMIQVARRQDFNVYYNTSHEGRGSGLLKWLFLCEYRERQTHYI